ncbi:MAG: zinc ribbon domain-containing protein [Chloroflexi bacterium]|nr:zinc ribbon domain-containing protein [Chloroflexota bacterium]
MPIYEYECSQCRHRFERRQGFHEEPIAMCPQCDSKARRVIHASAVIYKGSGWYVTDYAHKSVAGGNGQKPAESKAKGDGAEKATVPVASEKKPEASKKKSEAKET